jgi:adenylylsulfate kinase
MVIWFTGLSSAGKTTIARQIEAGVVAAGLKVQLLDGDEIRRTLSRDLGFTPEDRDENVRRIGFVASLLERHGVIVLIAAISPSRASRESVRNLCSRFVEVYVNAPLEVCEQRDTKDLYRRARIGEIKHVTGIDDRYEPPLDFDVECCTDREPIEESVAKVFNAIRPQLPQLDQGGQAAPGV